MPREIFVRTQFIRQQDLGPLGDMAYDITEQIANAMDAQRRNRLVGQAQDALQRALSEQVGSQRATDTPLALVDERLQELLVEKKMIQLQYRSLMDDLAAQGEHKHALESELRERDKVKYCLTLTRLNALAYRIREVEKLTNSEASLREQFAGLEAWADFPLKTREPIVRLAQERQSHLERLARAEGAAQPSREQVEELQVQAAKQREQVRALESARTVPLEFETAAHELEPRLPEAMHLFQRVDDELSTVKQAITALEPVRLAYERRKDLGQPAADQVHDLHLQWTLLNQQVVDAEREVADSEERWRAHNLSDEEFEQLASKARDITPMFIDKLRKHQTTAALMQKHIAHGLPSRAMRTFTAAAALHALIGITLLISTILDEKTYWAVEGTVFLFGALMADAIAWLSYALVAQEREVVRREQATVREALATLGFASINELEMIYTHYQQVRPAYANMRRARAALEKIMQQREVIRAQLVPLLQTPAPDEVTPERMQEAEDEGKRIARDLEELARLERQREALEAEWQQQHDAMQQAVQQTRGILKAASMIELNLLADLRSYLVLCQNRRELDQVEGQLHSLDSVLSGKLETTLALEAEARTERTALLGIEDELRMVLQRIDIGGDDLNEALKEYDVRYEQAERYVRIKAILQSLERECQALLRSQTLDELKELLSMHAANLHAMAQRRPEFAELASEDSEDTLQVALAEAQLRVDKSHNALAAIERRLEAGAKEYRTLAEVEEDLVNAQERLTHLTVEGRALQLASEQLAAAAEDYHRNFLPRLNQVMARYLEVSTAGQYREVEVDRTNLGVRVAVPSLSALIAPEQLSQGVQDQIYLLLRFGLAELISDGREPLPYLLDDPFVNYDDERLHDTLALMERVTERTQLLLFTKDDYIMHWFTSKDFDPARHHLHMLA
ncbi:MAG: hypothetical protein E6J26_03795 [Chloroflexi bacterium]|nr:MAG: hypothetical protein E6J26_03795 [Chloroflexota bacterium]